MANKNTCEVLKKVSADEPIFVLRAQDISASQVVLDWINRNPQLSDAKWQEAVMCAEEMRRWPNKKAAD